MRAALSNLLDYSPDWDDMTRAKRIQRHMGGSFCNKLMQPACRLRTPSQRTRPMGCATTHERQPFFLGLASAVPSTWLDQARPHFHRSSLVLIYKVVREINLLPEEKPECLAVGGASGGGLECIRRKVLAPHSQLPVCEYGLVG